ncbi:cupredoxin domain-containing protein [Noviherbaspirillum saxi]|uniref:Plastocyanin n=1 Tax=Noviherbaspirillum saxi TaxID=2320863 RepID=A0A3A3FQ56_9BURK|nr:cupredoxin family protein [Noviherbaspirillum saxi]RJF98166.1 plastocyanin [Noviherbaspirillum saxi]
MNKQTTIKALSAIVMSLTVAIGASAAYAHSGETHKKATANTPISTDEHAFGKQGDPKKATRTISIDMADTMRFGRADITVKEGETIKFVVTNKGKMMHEMVIGTMDELKAHGELMKKHPGMEHDEPYMSHVSPGKKEEMVWQFTKAGEFYYACLIPGHFEAGMVGKIKVTKG